ncbi:MAG TPA: DUF1501 domain-containing protein [Dehalococcoidia bacterium]|nr:DUF1501 domain-containing protein [Dehalococcoidia bacterium]
MIIQMAGGNDGLNTVIPYSDSNYLGVRPNLRVDPATVLQLNDRLGLNPAMAGLKNLWDANQLAIIEGVGYPNPSYSHFDSMAIWQTAAPKGEFSDGWLGRYFKQTAAEANADFAGIDIGGALAPMFKTPGVTIPVVQSPAGYKLALDPRDAAARLEAWRDLQTAASTRQRYLPLIASAAVNAQRSTQVLARAVSEYQPSVTYGKDPLSGSLRVLASVIVQEAGTKVGYAMLGGFDTHSNERKTQDQLLTTLSDALSNFQADLVAHGKADDVLIVTWTEFGRRVKENGSQGTDHGDGGSMFVLGNGVKPGIYGDPPDLMQLDSNGSIQWSTDFRSVYATLLQGWLGVDSTGILGARFTPVPFLAA